MDTRLYLEINRLARETPFAHGTARAFALVAGLVAIAAVLLVAYWRARSGSTSGGPRQVAAVLWTAAGAAAAIGLCGPLGGLLGEPRPFLAHPGVEVLLQPVLGPALPSTQAAVAGAALLGCFLARDRLAGTAAAALALLLAFDLVYVGLLSPAGVLSGLGFGMAVTLAGYPVAVLTLERAVSAVGRTPLGVLVAPGSTRSRRRPATWRREGSDEVAGAGDAGPAARPPVLAATGAVRLLGDGLPSPRPLPAGEPARPSSSGEAAITTW